MLLMPLLLLTNIQVLIMCHALCIVDYFVHYLKDFMKKLKMSNPNNLSKISQFMVAELAYLLSKPRKNKNLCLTFIKGKM